MTRKHTPEMAKLTGAAKKNPQRYRKVAPKSKYDIGPPPEYFSKEQKKIWAEVVKYGLPGQLTGSDRFHLESTVQLLDEMRHPPSYGFTSANRSLLVSCLAKLGMNPQDRNRLGVQPLLPVKSKKDTDDFSEFK